jgi:hypothetical protein
LLHAYGSGSSNRRQGDRAYHRSDGRTTTGKPPICSWKRPLFAGTSPEIRHVLHRCGLCRLPGWATRADPASCGDFRASAARSDGCGQLLPEGPWARCLYSATAVGQRSIALLNHETHLPAQCAPAEAQARISRADVYACRPGDSQAPAGTGPQAALRLRRHEGQDSSCPRSVSRTAEAPDR